VASVLREDTRDQAFARLYEQYAKDVYRYALAVMRNPADAEDVVQTTFMNAYRAYKKGDEEILKPQHWLIKIAHNACRTRAIRASRRPREVPMDEQVHELSLPEDEKPNVAAVLEALANLPFNQRSALVMRELEGRSYEEIAETLTVTVSAVETLIFRARRSLRLKREALRGLLLVPLPESLHGLFSSGAATTGGIALGGGVAVKAAAVIAALMAGGAGYEAVQSTADSHPTRKPAQGPIPVLGAVQISAPATKAAKIAAATAQSIGAAHRPLRSNAMAARRESRPTGSAADPAQSPGSSPTAPVTPAAAPSQPEAAPSVPATGPKLLPRRKRSGRLARPLVPTPAVPTLPTPTLPSLPTDTLPTLPAPPVTTPTVPPPTLPDLPPPPPVPQGPDGLPSIQSATAAPLPEVSPLNVP
jgi:RNA polymerase sigma factor (sigma-70 family)